MKTLTPLWKMPTREQAKEILIVSRARTDALAGHLTAAEMKRTTNLGGGAWSVKDLLGHLAGYEEQAVAIITGQRTTFDYAGVGSVDERNAADLARKSKWSVSRARKELQTRRSAFLEAIESMDDERWTSKIQTRNGRSALGLVLGKLLVGGHHGLFAHDLAHIRDLERSVKLLRTSDE